MDSAEEQSRARPPPKPTAYLFRGFALDSIRGVLVRPDGCEIALRPKSTEVLCHLARHAAQVVPRDDLMETVWAKVSVTDDSLTQCVAEIRRALGDEGAHLLRTLPKRGYTLAAEVTPGGSVPANGTPPAALAEAVVPPARDPAPARPRRRWSVLVGAGLLAMALVAAMSWRILPGTSRAPVSGAVPGAAAVAALPGDPAVDAPREPRPLSLVVLPFTNLAGVPGQDHVADGITEELTNALARLSGSFVVGRGTAMAYRGQAVDPRQLRRELGVLYVVQGSVRTVGPELWVSAQVLDTWTGAHLWAESFREPLVEFADLSHLIAARIAAVLNNTLTWIEGERAGKVLPQDATAVDLLLRARALQGAPPRMEHLLEARSLLERSLALDEYSASAHAFLGITLVNLWNQNWEEDREGLLRRAEEHGRRALELNPWYAMGHYVRGMVHQGRQRFDQALAAFETTLSLAPNLPYVYARRGWVKNLTDRPDEALADFTQAVQISPREPYIGAIHWGMATAKLMLGRDGEAAVLALQAVEGNPDLPNVRLQLAATLALVGRTEEARVALAEYRKMSPDMTVAHFRRRARENTSYPLFLGTLDREAEALRMIGLPGE